MSLIQSKTIALVGCYLIFITSFASQFVKTSAATRNPAAVKTTTGHAPPCENIDWESFRFGLNGVKTDYMWLDRVQLLDDKGEKKMEEELAYSSMKKDCLVPFKTLELSPASTVLNYGQALFEGLKAFRRADGTICVFRPEKNAERMQQGAKKFLLPPIPTDTFIQAIDNVVRENAKWVPPFGKGALYLRPLLLGTGAALGVSPSPESTFCVYCSPVGNYFKGGLTAIRLQVVKGFSRAAPGAGSIKASGNYAPAFLVQRQVKARGYDEVLGLDAITGESLEEAGASNFFAIFPNNTIVTPSLDHETILPGVTRRSILELAANEFGLTAIQGRVTLSDLKEATEAFCCGTGACITPVGCISLYDEEEEKTTILFGDYDATSPGPITKSLYNMLTGLQTGSADEKLTEKYKHWIHVVES